MPPRVRKRNRKRKRRNVSSSSSSSSASSEDSSPSPPKAPLPVIANSSDSDTSSSSPSSSSASSTPTRGATPIKLDPLQQNFPSRYPSRTPSLPDTALPALVPINPTTATEKEKEKVLKEKFRKFWMASIADGFKDDLEQIRKEPNMTKSRLSVLINALASGADVFSSVTQSSSRTQINEMEVVMGSSSS